MRSLKPGHLLGCVLAFTALPVNAAGLQPGRIDDTPEDAVRAADDAQDVVNMAAYEDRVIIPPPFEPVVLDVPVAAPPPAFALPANEVIVTGARDDTVLPLFLFGGLAALPLIFALGSGSAGGGSSIIPSPPPTGEPPPGIPGGPQEPGGPNPPVPPVIPEPGTWAMLLLGFGAIGAMMRRASAERRRRAQAAA